MWPIKPKDKECFAPGGSNRKRLTFQASQHIIFFQHLRRWKIQNSSLIADAHLIFVGETSEIEMVSPDISQSIESQSPSENTVLEQSGLRRSQREKLHENAMETLLLYQKILRLP